MIKDNKFHIRISSDDQMLIELWAKLYGKGITDSLVDLVKEKMLDELHKNKDEFLNQIKNHVDKMTSLKAILKDPEAIAVLEKRIVYVNGVHDMLVEFLKEEESSGKKWLE